MDVSTESEIKSATIESESPSEAQVDTSVVDHHEIAGVHQALPDNVGKDVPEMGASTMPNIASPAIESAPCEIDEMPQKPIDPTNAKSNKTFMVIHLGPSQEMQGSTKFLNLHTVSVIDRQNGTSLPVMQGPSNQVITVVISDGEPSTLFVDEGAPVKTSNIKTLAET